MGNTTDLIDSYRQNPSDDAFEKLHAEFRESIRRTVVGQISPDLLRRIRITEVVDTALRKGIPDIANETEITNSWDAESFLRLRAKNAAISEVRKHLAEKRSVGREVDDPDVATSAMDKSGTSNIGEFNELVQIIGDTISRLEAPESRLIGQLRVVEVLPCVSVQHAIVEAGFDSIPIATIEYKAKKIRKQIEIALINAGYMESQ